MSSAKKPKESIQEFEKRILGHLQDCIFGAAPEISRDHLRHCIRKFAAHLATEYENELRSLRSANRALERRLEGGQGHDP